MLKIIQAENRDLKKVNRFYENLIDKMKNSSYPPGWQKGVYPSEKFLADSVRKGELYMGMLDHKTAACMVVNHSWNEGYEKAEWSVKAERCQVSAIHALGVDPDHGKKGLAKGMVRFVLEQAGKAGQKTVRLDVLKENLPAVQLYTGLGFQYCQTLKMYYEDTGWTEFELYEYIL